MASWHEPRDPGLHNGIPADVYHADPCDEPSLSSSIACTLVEKSPRHAHHAHPRLNPDYQRSAEPKYDVGTAAHAMLLQGDDIVAVCPYDSWRSNAAKEAADSARAAGRIPLLETKYRDVVAMVDAFAEQIVHMDLDPLPLLRGSAEVTMIWTEDDITCRARLDWLHDDDMVIDDYKTTSASASPEWWTKRTLWGIGADVQTAFYLRGMRKLGMDARMRYVVQETYPPFALSVIDLGPDVLALGEAKVERAIGLWRQCIRSGDWPGYAQRAATAKLPAWKEAEFLALEEIAA